MSGMLGALGGDQHEVFEIQCVGSSHARRLGEFLGRSSTRLRCVTSFSFPGAKIADVRREFLANPEVLRGDVPVVLFLGGNDLLRDTPVRGV